MTATMGGLWPKPETRDAAESKEASAGLRVLAETVFKHLDKDADGTLAVDDDSLSQNEAVSGNEAFEYLLQSADTDEDGMICAADFVDFVLEAALGTLTQRLRRSFPGYRLFLHYISRILLTVVI